MYPILSLKTTSEEAFSDGRELERLENKLSELSLNICIGARDISELDKLKETMSGAYDRYISLANKYSVNSNEIVRVNEKYKRAMDYTREIKKDDSSVVATYLDSV
nr:hypothetical protein [Candidatus Woesearchaeota archaeon]